jgi:YbbR domain-containing protein
MIATIRSNLGLKLLSLGIAILLWFIVLGTRNVEVTKEIPIELITPADLVVSNEIPDKVSFRLSGPKAFLRTIINRKEEPLKVNLSQSKAGLVTYRFFSDNIQVPIGVKILSITPTAMILKLEPVKKKEIPIRLLTKGESIAGFKVERLELLNTTVKVKGAESKIESLQEINTAPVDVSLLRETGEKEVSVDLAKQPGIFLESPLPKIRFDVRQTSTNYKIRNVSLKVLTNRRFELDPSEVSVYVKCPPEELKNLARSKIYGILDLKNKGPGIYKEEVNVQLPSTFKLIKVLPSKVKVTLI